MKKKTVSKAKTTKVAKAIKASKATQANKVAKAAEAKIEAKAEKKPVVKAGQLPEDRQELIDLFAQKKGDTGSPEVQVALLSHKIDRLTLHLGENKKDNHSRRGLLKVIAKRRRILNYLQKLDEKRYKGLIDKIGLKR